MFKLTTSSTTYIQTNKHVVKQKKIDRIWKNNPSKSGQNGERYQKSIQECIWNKGKVIYIPMYISE